MKSIPFALGLLAFGCGQPLPRALPAQPAYTAQGEFSTRNQEVYGICLDTGYQQFRLENKERLYVGLFEGFSEVKVVDLKTNCYFVYSPSREREIEQKFGGSAASLYRDAVAQAQVEPTLETLKQIFASPCHQIGKPHQGCSQSQDEQGMQLWKHHKVHGHFVGFLDYRRTTHYYEHRVDPQLGLVVEQVWRPGKGGSPTTGFRLDLEVTPLGQEVFGPPPGCQLTLQDEALQAEQPATTGWSKMLRGHPFEGAAQISTFELPPAPARGQWTITKETWTLAGDKSKALSLETATPEYPVSLAPGPPVPAKLGFDFGREPWELKAQVGQYSRLDSGRRSRRLVFAQNGRLYKLGCDSKEFTDQDLLSIARSIAQREKAKKSLDTGKPFRQLGKALRVDGQQFVLQSAEDLRDDPKAGVDSQGWHWYREVWISQTLSEPRRDVYRVEVTAGIPATPQRLNSLPLPGGITQWDRETEVGERSCWHKRESGAQGITFLAGGQVISLFSPEGFEDRQKFLALAHQVAARASAPR